MASTEKLRQISGAMRAFLQAMLRKKIETTPSYQSAWGAISPIEIIDRHLTPEHALSEVGREQILSRLLESVQNKQSASNVIGGSVIGGWDALGEMLFGFNPECILKAWASSDELMKFFLKQNEENKITGQMRTQPTSIWPQFSKSVISASLFMARYPTAQSFLDWLDNFRGSKETAAALPLVLAEEIHGFGLPLAADFLKELGCDEFPKPDVHVWKLASRLGISNATTNYGMMLDIMRAARQIQMTPYEFDKLLWLTGSGRFYRFQMKNADGSFTELQIGRCADAFLEFMESKPQLAY